ncbi:MAG TPA: LPS export ABC transporter permease LptF [Candidatus Limnocylindria bacterium]|nr:LPS export ABC transporter permease LptF [Candidatus Limnocylindria bacterium]
MGRILYRYTLREMMTPFLLGLGVFTFVLLLARLLRLIELVVNRGLPATQVLRLFSYLLPAFLEVTVPMAMLLAILVAFGRLSADSEITALRSAGVSLYQLTPGVATIVAASTLVTLLLATHARPWGNHAMRLALFEIARTRATAGIRPQVFNDEFDGLTIYTERVDNTTDRLVHLLIADQRDPNQQNTIFAAHGVLVSDPERHAVTLRLEDGVIYTRDASGRAEYRTEFESYAVSLDLEATLAGLSEEPEDPKELTLPALAARIESNRANGLPVTRELAEYHRKFAIPFACVVFGLLGLPLGVQPGRAVKSRGFTVSVVVIFVYYILLSVGQALAEQDRMPAALGLWLPNLVLGIAGLVIFHRAARERPVLPTLPTERLRRLLRRVAPQLAGGPAA